MSGIIPKEQLANIRPWQVSSFGAEAVNTPPRQFAPANQASSAPETEQQPVPESEPIETPRLPTATEIEQIVEQARQQGYETGLTEGRQAAEEILQKAEADARQKIAEQFAGLEQAMRAVDQQIAENLLDLAIEVARQVIRGSINVNRDLLLPAIREALQALPLHHDTVALHIHPDDATALEEALAELAGQTRLQIAPDRSISRGGCILKSGQSEIDATLETRWRRTLEAIGLNPETWQTP